MTNLLEALLSAGLSAEQATKAIQVTYQWTDEKYPVLGTLSRSTILEPLGITIPPNNSNRMAAPTQPSSIIYN